MEPFRQSLVGEGEPVIEGVCWKRRMNMLSWALTFLVVAIIAGVLGFGGIAVVSVEIARILFVVFLILFVLAAFAHALRGRSPPL